LTVTAPAKINLTLEVVGVEPNGYHLLDTVFCWLELADTLELERAEASSLSMTDCGVNTSEVTTDEDNLVLKALRATEKKVGHALPTRIDLHKRIPSGGGLGGGSADAAATLFALNILHDLQLSQEQLLELARPLGADVAFGLVGGIARGTRYGDQLEPANARPELLDRNLVLVMPGFGCPTPTVYGLWDEQPSHTARGASQAWLSASDSEEQIKVIANDLEEPAFRLHPRLRDYKKTMIEAGLEGVCLSGSGSTLFGFLPPHRNFPSVLSDLSVLEARIEQTRLKESTRFGLVS
jgi:4-diphosphocytidyl-2-C-methyl-D-erythritol kinase